MRGWQLVLLTLGLLWGSTHSHCDCQDDEHGSFSLEFSGEVSLSGDLPGCPFTVHHHDHPDDHHHHDDGPDWSSGFLDLGHGSLHEDISAELELDVDNHHDHDHYDHSHHDHSYSHEHHPPEHDHNHDYEVDYTADVGDILFYYRK